MYSRDVQTTEIETETAADDEEDIRQRILQDIELDRIARDKDIEEESVQLDKEIEQEIRGKQFSTLNDAPF